MKKSKIVLSYPFSGSLYAFFTKEVGKQNVSGMLSHPYYKNLFGRNYEKLYELTLTLSVLYDEIIILPAGCTYT